ncbi:hypothetical protein ROTAS13_02774 [Roseomonas sp. TAS13]|jgi:hypothetical protein|uniref:Uncharacterized protein n=2 Tax=Roseomonadaceae TaxID=3385906 RepID=A0A1M6RMF6_9PROT|nr:hypothetical protein CR162_21245 [Pseudoroseomonas rhizosphaerae]PZR08342.1 MAG: hypothetical protein DI532_22030 [Azospirillum brasilense]GAV35102.1 hypothetical protein ROTAS13_02774 [Roseomonas sp. TAS13]SHK33609.1 hypothetical protein SAMN02745194_04726 [Roseomonas rosea]
MGVTLHGEHHGAYRPAMGMPVLRRLLLVLTALAFVLATALPGTASAMPMPGGTTTAGGPGQSCGDCAAKAPGGDGGAKMMPCSALACLGAFVGLPAPAVLSAPVAVAFEYAVGAPAGQRGRALPPDPFPPRPTTLV